MRKSTTLDNVVMPIEVNNEIQVKPSDLNKYQYNGYGKWKYEKGQGYNVRTDLMPKDYIKSEVDKKVCSFFSISDIHITDKESPLQVIALGYYKPFPSAYSAVSLYSTHVLDAAIRKVNKLHEESPFDFGISLGDNANNCQYNELRWFIDVMDGKEIRPSTGAHLGEEKIAYQKKYKSEGLNKEIPWYQVIGNHDQFFTGVFPIDKQVKDILVGEEVANLSIDIIETGDTKNTGFYMGTVDGNTENGDVIGIGPEKSFSSVPKIVADEDRCPIKIEDKEVSGFIEEFFNTETKPLGHGFSKENLDKDFACYTFEPKSSIPLRVIVLDDTTRNGDTKEYIWAHGQGSLDKKRYDFLVNELERGQKEGYTMIVTAHIPIVSMEVGSPSGWSKTSEISEEKLIDTLRNYSNFVLWLSGHNHRNVSVPVLSDIKDKPERGFWVVEISSLRDFPQQLTTLDLYKNKDNTLSIKVTAVDYDVEDNEIVEKSRSFAIASRQSTGEKFDSMVNNVELIVPYKN